LYQVKNNAKLHQTANENIKKRAKQLMMKVKMPNEQQVFFET